MTRRLLATLLGAAWTAAYGSALAQAQDNPSFNIANRAITAINEVYASPSDMTNWGSNRLINVSVPPGQRYAVRLPADGTCVYDVKVIYANGRTDERLGVNTCEIEDLPFPGGTASPNRQARQTQADRRPFRLVNRGRSGISELYVSPSGEDGWGQDRLGDDTVAPGTSYVIRLPTIPCSYDLRIVYANGEATEKRRLNLCTTTDLRVP